MRSHLDTKPSLAFLLFPHSFWVFIILSPRGRSGHLVFPSLSEFSTVYCDPHSQRLPKESSLTTFSKSTNHLCLLFLSWIDFLFSTKHHVFICFWSLFLIRLQTPREQRYYFIHYWTPPPRRWPAYSWPSFKIWQMTKWMYKWVIDNRRHPRQRREGRQLRILKRNRLAKNKYLSWGRQGKTRVVNTKIKIK